MPGEYAVTLKVGEEELSHNFSIIKDPRVEVPNADMQKQFHGEIDRAWAEIKKEIFQI